MVTLTFLSFFLLTFSFISLWVRRDRKIWGSSLGLSLLFGLIIGNVLWLGLAFLLGLFVLWIFYLKKPTVALFVALTMITVCFKLGFFSGFDPIFITSRFRIGLDQAIIGLFPLALLVPLAQSIKDWRMVLKGFLVGCAGIGVLAILATITGVTHWEFKLPPFMSLRTWSNLILTSIPEEGFYRGFLQRELSRYFQDTKIGKIASLILTSILFTFAHVYWSPDIAVLGFVFLASLLYGGVYLISGKIESAILCHFLLNFIHMTFFSYHAL